MQLDLGKKIRELRRRNGCTQEALAEAIGVTSQAVSRWEANGGYPDMEMIPSIANYFGISIDELFGYVNERSVRIDELAAKINHMNQQNNGVNVNIDECIALARNALIEFPGNEKLLLCLASVLFNAGYVRYGEFHLIDAEGYGIYDAERHRTYTEWTEAISIFEKLLKSMEHGEMRNNAVHMLSQLYLNVGDHTRALELAKTAPGVSGSQVFLKIKAADGKERARAHGEALLEIVHECSALMTQTVFVYEQNMSVSDKVQGIRNAIDIYNLVCTDGCCGVYHGHRARLYTLLSLYLWLDGKKDQAFEALDDSLAEFRLFIKYCESNGYGNYTAPQICLVPYDKITPPKSAVSLAQDWPWWGVQERVTVEPEIKADPRWDAWVAKLQ